MVQLLCVMKSHHFDMTSVVGKKIKLTLQTHAFVATKFFEFYISFSAYLINYI